MRGLIYKDVQLFIRSIDKRLMLIAAAIIAFILIKLGALGGLYATVMFAYTIGLLNMMCFDLDEKAGWKKYQLALPVSSFQIVAAKYASVLCTLVLSLIGSFVFNGIASAITSNFNIVIWGLSMAGAIAIPLIWTDIFLPLTYCFGFRTAQSVGILAAIPTVYMINYFEDGPGLSSLPASNYSVLIIGCAVTIALFVLSFFVSVYGYAKNSTKD